jgi:hypothetical protein
MEWSSVASGTAKRRLSKGTTMKPAVLALAAASVLTALLATATLAAAADSTVEASSTVGRTWASTRG